MSTSNDTNNKLKSPKSLLLAMALLSLWVTGCTQIVAPIDAIPAARVPKELLVQATNNTRSLDFTRLRRPAEREYKIDKGDVLGIFIDGVLGNTNESPPIQLQSAESDLPPAIGYPYPVRDNGTLPLPLISPIYVTGMTIAEAEVAIKRAYADAGVLKKVEDTPEITGEETDPTETKKTVPADISEVRTIVTLMKRRTYRVVVIRQDNFAERNTRSSELTIQKGSSQALSSVLQLEEGKNDVLQALSLSGGLPGFRAKNEVKIYRGGSKKNYEEKDRRVLEHYQTYFMNCDPCFIPPDFQAEEDAILIPLRLGPGEVPQFKQQDVILNDGDIVVVESREREVFYTGGLLGGGEYPLPRDYDIDVLTAMSIAKQGFGALQQRGGGGGGMGGQMVREIPPGQLIVLRELPGNKQIAIEVDLTKAINDPRSRILVAPGDKLILRHKSIEEILNFGASTFFTFGIRELFSN
ncbi:polysaccharide biosynthesis/export family protein [bacterium]|nr:polysaccharide biosynthesis/export family protein [bacterium]